MISELMHKRQQMLDHALKNKAFPSLDEVKKCAADVLKRRALARMWEDEWATFLNGAKVASNATYAGLDERQLLLVFNEKYGKQPSPDVESWNELRRKFYDGQIDKSRKWLPSLASSKFYKKLDEAYSPFTYLTNRENLGQESLEAALQADSSVLRYIKAIECAVVDFALASKQVDVREEALQWTAGRVGFAVLDSLIKHDGLVGFPCKNVLTTMTTTLSEVQYSCTKVE
jgi:hypothetical protein